ncbi:hypothetical protein [Burkholderia ubonensis]|uniref:hypothetical protein n=1 Tax=Burkholderia ubonensis TaxID=101571 RepID=UPI0012FC9E40|nr:hypothetical protein [Burkholderia ubonensis]
MWRLFDIADILFRHENREAGLTKDGGQKGGNKERNREGIALEGVIRWDANARH